MNRGELQSEQKLRVASLPLPARTEYVFGVPEACYLALPHRPRSVAPPTSQGKWRVSHSRMSGYGNLDCPLRVQLPPLRFVNQYRYDGLRWRSEGSPLRLAAEAVFKFDVH